MNIYLSIIDWALFLFTACTVLYMLYFAIGSLLYKHDRYPYALKKARFLILIPAYAEDKVIETTIMSLLDQTYAKKDYDVMVISDHMSELTNFKLAQYPIHLVLPKFPEGESSKAKALNFAMKNLPGLRHYDMVIVLDADNQVDEDFLEGMNNAFQAGIHIIQAHRVSKNINTSSALLDACFEEINNSIFRKGHVYWEYSSALVGSGIGFKYEWFRENVTKVFTTGEDKEFEALLLRQGNYVEYLDDVKVYDEKTQKAENFNKQRRRWMAAQLAALRHNIKNLPMAFLEHQYDYIDKVIQWMLIPRTLLMGIILVMCIILPFFSGVAASKWYIMGAVVVFIYAMCLPDYLITPDFKYKFMRGVPNVMWGAVTNLFHLKGADKKFEHTEHSITTK